MLLRAAQHGVAQSSFSLGVREAKVVPAGPRPLRHRIRLAREPLPVALEVPPLGSPGQASLGIVPGLEGVHLRERQRELGDVLDGDRAAQKRLGSVYSIYIHMWGGLGGGGSDIKVINI